MPWNDGIDRRIRLCIDEALNSLGLRGKQALLNHLEDAGLRKDAILDNPGLFCKGLGLVLGEKSADVIEASIVERLVSSFELKQTSDLTLAKAIDLIRTADKESHENGRKASCDQYFDTDRCKNLLNK
jgi:hypothetical protein